MPLTLMYITNRSEVALLAQEAGIDRIWVDLEYIGKEERQPGMDTVKSRHTVADIQRLRPVVTKSALMVRVNPIHDATKDYCSSEEEIEAVIQSGADVIMLPYFKTRAEVERYVEDVNGRAKVMILVETAEAVESIDEILSVPGVDEVHVGLNDLHLVHHQKFMFELLSDGTVEQLCGRIRQHNLRYGFGGIARIGHGTLPAEFVICEHYRLGSQMAIVSRAFCDANTVKDVSTVEQIFIDGVCGIRAREHEVMNYLPEEFEKNRLTTNKLIQKIVQDIK